MLLLVPVRQLMKVVSLHLVTPRSPTQWVGETVDGQTVYVRYRHGWLSVGVGRDLDAAIEDETIGRNVEGDSCSEMSYDMLQTSIPEVEWPERLS